jgi:predicted PurR-regulated permease PerM
MNRDAAVREERSVAAEPRSVRDRWEWMTRMHRPFLLVVVVFSLYLTYMILQPFLHTVVLAIVLASLFHPLQLRLARVFRGRRGLAALLTLFVIVFAIVLPLVFFLSTLVAQGVLSVNLVSEWIKAGNLDLLLHDARIQEFTQWTREHAGVIDLQKLDIQGNLLRFSRNFGQFLISKGANLLGDLAGIIARFFIMMFIVFYLLRDGAEMVDKVKYLAPLRKEQEDRILEKIQAVARSALLGSFFTALSQGLVGGIGLYLVGIPGLFWGTMMGFCSLIPIVGTGLIWVPAAVYLGILGKWKAMAFLVVWSVVLLGSIDNFLRPFLMKGQAGMPPFYIFLAIVGGVQCFGLVGILYGPLILAFAMVMLYIYEIEYQELLVGLEEAAAEAIPPPACRAE